jgi:hypothetical protein
MATFTFRIRFSKWPASTHVVTRMMTLTELTVENRRSHQLAPFVRRKPRSMSEIAMFRQ